MNILSLPIIGAFIESYSNSNKLVLEEFKIKLVRNLVEEFNTIPVLGSISNLDSSSSS